MSGPGVFRCLSIVVLLLSIAGCDSASEPPASTVTTPAVEEWSDNGLQMSFCWIPPGSFTMGSPKTEAGRSIHGAEDQVSVTLTRGFWLGKHEVTQGEWTAVMSTEPWKGKPLVREGANYAASWVSWDDATAFCKQLTEREREAGLLSADWEYRLPTEAEWEYACRAGSQTMYSFGDDASQLGDYAWFFENAHNVGEKYAHQVGQKRPNAWGLLDMHGNVWERCADLYQGQLPGGRDPFVVSGGSAALGRLGRGGSWGSHAENCRAALRVLGSASERDYDLGLRVVRSSIERASGAGNGTLEEGDGAPNGGAAATNERPHPTGAP
jgi:sulfatase modifying factor 1